MLKTQCSLLLVIIFAVAVGDNSHGQDYSAAASSLEEESNSLRQLLIKSYRSNSLFGELLLKNSKIRGSARKLKSKIESGDDWKSDASKLDQLIFDLESKIGEANSEDSLAESKSVSKVIGSMVASIAAINGVDTVETSLRNPQPADPGSLNDLLATEYQPLVGSMASSELNAPLIMGQGLESEIPPPDLVFDAPSPQTVLENPLELLAPTESDPLLLELPDLTRPSPDIVESGVGQAVLKPLLVPDQNNVAPFRIPRMQAPAPLNYGNNVLPVRDRLLSVPIQFEFHSFNPGGIFGYQPYGGYQSRGYGGYRGYGGGGGGRYCPYGR